MSIITTFVCECNGINYCNKSNFDQHKKTKKHIQYEVTKEIKMLKIKLTDLENKNNIQQSKIATLTEENNYLKDIISIMKNLTFSKKQEKELECINLIEL